jgi:hypothetical protein
MMEVHRQTSALLAGLGMLIVLAGLWFELPAVAKPPRQ